MNEQIDSGPEWRMSRCLAAVAIGSTSVRILALVKVKDVLLSSCRDARLSRQAAGRAAGRAAGWGCGRDPGGAGTKLGHAHELFT